MICTRWPELESAVGSLVPGSVVLELGTGRGSMFRYLAGLVSVNPATSLVTLDVDPRASGSASRYLEGLPPSVRARISALTCDVVDWASGNAGLCRLVVASAFLSAVPLIRPFGIEEVLDSMAIAVAGGGLLFVEDYLPLPRPEPREDAGSLAAALWRWHKAVAELAGRPHYIEWPPSWVAARLERRGFSRIRWVTDERREMRPDASWEALVGAAAPPRPRGIDAGLWLALDRYRREINRTIAATGLLQWSGNYRLTAHKDRPDLPPCPKTQLC